MTTFPVPYRQLSVASWLPNPDTAPLSPVLHLLVDLPDGVQLDIRINDKRVALRLIDELVTNTAALWPYTRLSAGNGRRSMVAAAPGAPAPADAIDPSDSRRL